MRVLPILSLVSFSLLIVNCGKLSSSKSKGTSSFVAVGQLTAQTSTPNNIPFNNMFGVNGYEWNFLQNPADPNNGSLIYEPKMALARSFSALRHYMDWGQIEPNQGQYTFNPVHNGSWNYDAMYLRLKQDSILVLADLKTCPQWLQNTFPESMHDAENVPAPYGLDRNLPSTYVLQAQAAFQFAARYGSNKTVDPKLVTVNTTPRWTNDPVNVVKIGLNLIKYIECDNERDKWWKGPQTKQTAEQYAANMSAFYDGDKGRLGKNAGVKSADPNMQVVMGGLASANVQYLKDMIAWCKKNRGVKADGSINLCFDVINYHYYASDGNVLTGKTGTVGVAPELSLAGQIADNFVSVAQNSGHPVPVWVTENGYDINGASVQRAIAIGNKDVLLTQADWTVRSALLYMRHGINRLFFYQLYDDKTNGTGTYQTSGLLNDALNRRPAADYVTQTRSLMGQYTYKATLNGDPIVDEYVSGSKIIYVLTVPDQKGRTAQYKLNAGTSAVVVYHLKAGSNLMLQQNLPTTQGSIVIDVSETPVFVQPVTNN